jgi:hypothetical protein
MVCRVKKHLTICSTKRSFWIFFGILLLYGLSRIFGVYFFGDAIFGYDTGIYRRVLQEPIEFVFFFQTVLRPFFLVGLSLDTILFGLYFLVGLWVLVFFYLCVKRYSNTNTALIASLLFAFSTVQFDFFWWFYYRNLVALFFLLVIFYFYKKNAPVCFFSLILLISFHPLTGLFAVAIFCAYAVYKKEYYIIVWAAMGSFIAFAVNYKEFITYIDMLFDFSPTMHGVPQIRKGELTGQFMSVSVYLREAIFYLPFGCVGVYKYAKKNVLWAIVFFFSAFLIIIQFLLYKRFFIFLDLAVIFFAALYLNSIIVFIKDRTIKYMSIFIYTSFLVLNILFFSSTIAPEVSLEEVVHMVQLQDQIPEDQAILTVYNTYAPWVYGYAGRHVIIAPGMFEVKKWTMSEWEVFWTTRDHGVRNNLLSQYGLDKIYLFSGYKNIGYIEQLFLDNPKIIRVSKFVWLYTKNP